MQKLIICEKPKVAEKIANALAEGKVEARREHDVNYFRITRGGDELYVAAAVGHVYTLAEKVKRKNGGYPVFDIEWVPSYKAEKGAAYTRGYIKVLAELGKKAVEFVAACDYDIEGSLIGYNVIKYICGAKPEEGRRMKFSALTPEDLVDAYENRGPLDLQNAQAGEARHVLDWFYGINLSRALMAAIRSRGVYKVMSIGRVQGPALHILCQKERQIAAFVSTPYWQITTNSKGLRFTHIRDRFLKKEEAEGAKGRTGHAANVSKVEKKPFEQAPNPPFDLTSLQVEAYRCFGFAPTMTLELAQTLYEASLISYPRTSSQKLPAKLNMQKIISALAKNPQYAQFANALIAEKKFTPLEGKKEDPAHPAIHPTGLQGNGLGEREARLYDLIVKRFLACFGKPAKREAQRVELDSNGEVYVATGNRTTEQNWFAIYAPYVKLEEVTLPPFAMGEQVGLEHTKLEEKRTQPPKRFTPASIISELEDLNLGTKATRAVVIDTLAKRGYISGAKSITVTPFGISVVEALERNAPEILDEELTRSIEAEMEGIQSGEVAEEKVIEDGKAILTKIIDEFRQNEAQIGEALSAGLRQKEFEASLLGKCRSCGKELRAIRMKLGKQFVGCSGYPECRTTFPLPANAQIIPLGNVCGKCNTPMIRVVRKGRRPFEMCLDPNCESKKGWGKKPQAAGAQTAAAPATQAASAKTSATPAAAASPAKESAPAAKAAPANAPAASPAKESAPAAKAAPPAGQAQSPEPQAQTAPYKATCARSPDASHAVRLSAAADKGCNVRLANIRTGFGPRLLTAPLLYRFSTEPGDSKV